jgi:two-component system, NtrC family, response regulator
MKPKLLIVEDEEAIRAQFRHALRDDFTLFFAEGRAEALSALACEQPAVVSLDLGLAPNPESSEYGLETLDQIMKTEPATKVVVLGGSGGRESAIRSVQLGAFDYHQKPVQLYDLKVVLQRAAHLRTLEAEAEKRANDAAINFADMLGHTPAMREIFAVVSRIARTDVTVLIQGESGTGKELLARAVHANSARSRRPFVAINCGAIPDTLLESELFGHERGAYTGAHTQRKGKLELADGGTLFLDEIGEMSPPLQVKLLRFLQERELERVGGREVLHVDARVVAATNKDLKAELQARRFREDLYYRLGREPDPPAAARARGGHRAHRQRPAPAELSGASAEAPLRRVGARGHRASSLARERSRARERGRAGGPDGPRQARGGPRPRHRGQGSPRDVSSRVSGPRGAGRSRGSARQDAGKHHPGVAPARGEPTDPARTDRPLRSQRARFPVGAAGHADRFARIITAIAITGVSKSSRRIRDTPSAAPAEEDMP